MLFPRRRTQESPDPTDAILEHASASLSKFKLPVEITILDDLPKNPVGKIYKPTPPKVDRSDH